MADQAGGNSQSMAIWFPETNHSTTVDVHFNLWRIAHSLQTAKGKPGRFAKALRYASRSILGPRPRPKDFLDVGIMVRDPFALHSICFFLPMTVTRQSIRDLGPKFKDCHLATSIFNEKLNATDAASKHPIKLVRETDGGSYCWVYRFPLASASGTEIAENAMVVENKFDGTKITITEEAVTAARHIIQTGEQLYLRFRIHLPADPENAFVNISAPNDRFFTSGYDIVECLDLRLNETRNLPDGILQQMYPLDLTKAVKMRRLDFLLATGVTADFIGGHRTFHKSRLLESGIWERYVDGVELPRGMVIYHWKEPASALPVPPPPTENSLGEVSSRAQGLDDFNAFVKLRLRVSGFRTIWPYLSFAVVLGAVGGIAGNWGWERMKGLEKPIPTAAAAPTNGCEGGTIQSPRSSTTGKAESGEVKITEPADPFPGGRRN